MKFKQSDPAKACGTSLRGYVSLDYKNIVKKFGEGSKADEYKVSSEWVFSDENGETYTLYDYKATSLYDGTLPSVEKFRENQPYEWHIGAGNGNVENFKKWLIKKCKD